MNGMAPADFLRSRHLWLGREDSNLRMRAPKARVLPLDDAPVVIKIRIQESGDRIQEQIKKRSQKTGDRRKAE